MRKLFPAIIGLVTALGIASAGAQTYPSRPITLIVPFAAGGPADALARALGERMRASLGQTVIIENATGASGTIGVGRVVRAPPDGYTLGIGHVGTHVVNGAIFALPFDLLKDLEPVALLPSNSLLIVTKKTFPANDLKELIAWLKANPDKASAGTSGAGGGSHVNGVYFQNLTDTRFQFVPYRGTGPALTDLIAGQIDLMFDQASQFAGAGAGRHDQSLCGHGQGTARLPRPISRQSTKQACRDSIHRPGTGCGRRRAHRNPSSPSSVPPSWRRWPIPSCKSG